MSNTNHVPHVPHVPSVSRFAPATDAEATVGQLSFLARLRTEGFYLGGSTPATFAEAHEAIRQALENRAESPALPSQFRAIATAVMRGTVPMRETEPLFAVTERDGRMVPLATYGDCERVMSRYKVAFDEHKLSTHADRGRWCRNELGVPPQVFGLTPGKHVRFGANGHLEYPPVAERNASTDQTGGDA